MKKKPLGNSKRVASETHLLFFRSIIFPGAIVSIITTTIAFDFLSKNDSVKNVWEIINYSFLLNRNNQSGGINAVFIILFLTWFLACLLISLETFIFNRLKLIITTLFFSALISLTYIFLHAFQLSLVVKNLSISLESVMVQIKSFETIFSIFFIYILFLIFFLGLGLVNRWPEPQNIHPRHLFTISIVLSLLVFLIPANLRLIHADIAYKGSESFSQSDNWPVAIKIYDRVISLAPKEDYYQLFLVRAYLEQAKNFSNPAEREFLYSKAKKNLEKAIEINPLNPDHTANMARLFISWANVSNDETSRQEKLDFGVDYYKKAIELSPNNSRLWGELALIYNTQLSREDESFELLQKALALDPGYDWLNGLSGEFIFNKAESLSVDTIEKTRLYEQSLEAFQRGFNLSRSDDLQSRYRMYLSIARVMTRLNRINDAIISYQKAVQLLPDMPETWRIYEILSNLFLKIGKTSDALIQAKLSLELAPVDQKSRLENLINQISGSQ